MDIKMLSELYIDNIAIIEEASIRFERGLNIFTGETGAGKSILIDAINAILGERTSRDLIRSGAAKASVTALFTDVSAQAAARLLELGYEPDEDGTVLISREVTTDGRANCRICAKPVTVSILRELGGSLIDIHGQHDSRTLLDADKHTRFIDGFGSLAPLLQQYSAHYIQLCAIEKRLQAITIDESEKVRHIDLLTYQINEIEEAALESGEEETLLAERKRINNASRILEALNLAYESLTGSEEIEGANRLVTEAARALTDIAPVCEDVSDAAQRLDEISIELNEFENDIREILDEFEYDPRNLDKIEYRLDQIYRLKKKYGTSVDEILEYLERAQRELEEIEFSDELMQRLTAQRGEALEKANEAALTLSQRRDEAAAEFAHSVTNELVFLDMPNVEFAVQNTKGQMRANGIDNIQLLISTNPGEPPKPISKIASGGELSRIMLAIKTVLAGSDDVDTMIFDEIDAGVSGRAAQKIGLKLREIASGRQVICVTHLPQIAALGDHHMLIEKKVRDSKTFTEVHALDREERKGELARIMGGDAVTELTLSSADEMLKLAGH
ncbi:MAG: DNA repair protein RecN [Acetanaerobacterium sp.]